MNSRKPSAMDASEEIPALIETLLATKQRLEELTAGEVDTVTGRNGQTFLLGKAQEELRHSQTAKQAAILNALPAHIALLDRQGLIISVNDAWRRFAQANVFHAPGHGMGINYLDVCDRAKGNYSSEAHQVAAGIRAVLGGATKSFSLEYPCHSPNEPRWFLLAVRPLAEDHPNGAVVMHLNITERRQAEAAAIRLAAIVESSGDAIIGKNLVSIITSWNQGAELLFGYAAEEMVGTSIMRLLPADRPDEHQNILAKVRRGEKVEHFETVRQTKAGTLVDISVTASPIKDATSHVIGVSIVARDITERVRAESALGASQANLAAAQRLAHFGSWELALTNSKNVDANALHWSDEMFRIAGYEPGAVEVSNELFFRLVHPDDREPIRQCIASAIHERREYSIVHRLIRPDGETRVVQETGQIVCEEKTGQPLKIVGTAHDITERTRSEEALRESERGQRESATQLEAERARLVAAQAVAKVGSWETDLRTLVVTWSAETYRIFEAPADSFPGTHAEFLALVHPEDRASVGAAFRDSVGQAGPFSVQHRLLLPDGRIKHVEEHWQLSYDERGEAALAVGTCQDITERKRSEQVIERGLQRLTEAQRIGQIGDWEWDISTQVITWSPQVFEIFGRDPRLGPPRNYEEMTALFDAASQALMKVKVALVIESGEAQDYELRAHRPNGKPVEVLGRAVSRKDESGKIVGLVGTVQDITARKRAEAELEQAHQEVVAASRQAGMAEVATGILHNVGNVLNSVNVASSCVADSIRKSKAANLGKVVGLLREHAADLGNFLTVNPQGRQIPGYLAQLAEHLAGERTAALKELAHLQKNIEHIKDIVAMQQGFAKVSGAKELLSVTDLVEDALKMNASALARHDILVHREFQEVPLLTVEKQQVLQILVNLLRNAMQACDEANPLAKRITLRVTRGDEAVRIAVTDNGVGIPAKNLTRLFAHGFTTKRAGHGFGLHSAALAAKKMGGALTVHSDGPGQGATFTLELPCSTREETHE